MKSFVADFMIRFINHRIQRSRMVNSIKAAGKCGIQAKPDVSEGIHRNYFTGGTKTMDFRES